MMSKNELVPKRRFKGFNNDWEEKKLNDITDVRDGTHDSPKFYSEGHPFITSKNVKDGIINYNDVQYISNQDFENINKRSKVDKNDILMGMIGTIGNMALINKTPDFAIKNVALIKDTGIVFNLYLYPYLESPYIKKQLYDDMDGGTQKFISLGKIRNLLIRVPKTKEQEKIGQFFKHLDEMITLEQRKIDKTKALKSAYLAEMFPAEGERVPKRRFAGFTDDWEMERLGNIGQTFTGLSGKTKKDFGHGNAEFVTYLNVFNNPISNTSITENVEIDLKQDEVKYGDVLFTTSSETPHEVGMSSVWLYDRPNVYLNSFCFGYRISIDVNYLFVAYILRSNLIRKQMQVLAQGISRYNISKRKVMEITILLPSQKEQKKIGSFFEHLDDIISTHQQKLDKLKATKQAYLHEMFV